MVRTRIVLIKNFFQFFLGEDDEEVNGNDSDEDGVEGKASYHFTKFILIKKGRKKWLNFIKTFKMHYNFIFIHKINQNAHIYPKLNQSYFSEV